MSPLQPLSSAVPPAQAAPWVTGGRPTSPGLTQGLIFVFPSLLVFPMACVPLNVGNLSCQQPLYFLRAVLRLQGAEAANALSSLITNGSPGACALRHSGGGGLSGLGLPDCGGGACGPGGQIGSAVRGTSSVLGLCQHFPCTGWPPTFPVPDSNCPVTHSPRQSTVTCLCRQRAPHPLGNPLPLRL